MTEKMKNTLVEYRGGGYDGCIFEYNFAYYDKKGKYHSIFASGCMGCKNEEDLKKLPPQDIIYYKLGDKKDCNKIGETFAISNCLRLAEWFTQNNIDAYIPFVCAQCGERFNLVVQGMGIGKHGVGGIMIDYSELVCEDCHTIGTCGYCGEFVGENCLDEEHRCEFCRESDQE
jgi:hypothetical protein